MSGIRNGQPDMVLSATGGISSPVPLPSLPRRHRLRVRPQASPITYEASSDINERIFITPMVLPYYWPRVDIVISLYLEGPMRDAGGG